METNCSSSPYHFGITVMTCVLLGLASLSAHAAGSEIKRTANGKPDLSGTYDISTLTPYTRPAKFGERLTLSPEEAAEIEEGRRRYTQSQAAASDPDRDAPPAGANVGAYNDFWMDFGTTNFKLDGKYRTSVITDPPNGQMPKPTELLVDHYENGPKFDWGKNDGTAWWMETEGPNPYDDPEFNTPGVRCIYQDATTIPIRSLPYNNVYRILQTDTHVAIQVEWMHWTRTIRLDSEHPPAEITSLAGDSIGWWDGDTLVVETTNFSNLVGLPQAGRRVVERFSPIDASSLRYEFTVEDPRYEAPYSGESFWPRTDQKLYEYACHEGNYAMGGTLRGARLLEREWEKKKAGSSDN